MSRSSNMRGASRARAFGPCVLALCLPILGAGTGCGGQSGAITSDQLRPLRTLSSTEQVVNDDSLETRMGAIAQQMEDAGLSRGAIWQRGFVPAGSRETLRLEIPADTCATVVALASSGIRDVDATLYLPDGTQVAQDAQADSHPTLQVCAEGEGRYFYYTLLAYEGAGAYLVASFISDRSLFPRAAAIVGGRPGIASEAELSPEERVVQSFGESVQRRGFTAAKDPVRVQLAATQSVRVAVAVDVAHCYTVGAFALEGLEDVNLRVIDEEGRDIAFDASASRDASAQFCVDRSAQFSAELTAARGQGAAVVAIYAATESDAGGNSGLWLGFRASEQLSMRSLQETLREDAIRAAEAGYGEPAVRARGALVMGEAVEHSLSIKAGTCARIAANGGEGSGTMHLAISAGVEVTSRRLDESRVEVCANKVAQVQAIVVSRRGYGEYAVTAASKARR